MRANLIIFAVLCGVIALATFVTTTHTPVSKNAQDFAYQDINGTTGTLVAIDQPVILHFWATWCVPCLKELPALIDRANKTSEIMFMLISVDQQKEKIIEFLKPYSLNKNIIVIHDPTMQITDKQFKINQFPETIVLSQDKQIRRHLVGAADWKTVDLTR